jgi:DNA helicase II / ATP-dependent DNA helicase PcrA
MTELILQQLKTSFNIELNGQQRQAIVHKDGPAIVLAVPGAGKTTTMVVRIYVLIKCFKINPRNILTMTFSKSSAKDMKERYSKLFGEAEAEGVVFTTIHSFALSVIKNYENKHNKKFYIIEGNEEVDGRKNKISILKNIYKEVNNSFIAEDELDQLCNDIGLVNNRMIHKDEFKKYNLNIDNFSEIYKRYSLYKLKNDYIDFDDMLTKAFNILKENKDILNFYRSQYKYVLIDEGQDTSLIQHELVKLLIKPKNNIFLVADDDQSIYGFRGADSAPLKEFGNNYPGTKKYFIETNYRSTQDIIKAANEFIKMNDDREIKNMITGSKKRKPICIRTLKNEEEQIDHIIDYINKTKDKKNIAILYRYNISAITLIDELYRRKVPFYMKDSKVYLLRHWIMLDILSFMRFSLDDSDLEAFEKVYYRMNVFLPKAMLVYLKNKHRTGQPVLKMLLQYENLQPEQLEKIIDLESKFKLLRKLKPLAAIDFLSSEFNYNNYLKKYCKENNFSENSTDEILYIIKYISKTILTLGGFIGRISELQNVITKSMLNKNSNAVTLSTIHGVKGLEFDNVILIDLVEGKMPSADSVKKLQEDKTRELFSEEVRIFYVGITRAREELTLITLDYKNGRKTEKSRFLTRLEYIINPRQFENGKSKTIMEYKEPHYEEKDSKDNNIILPDTRVRHPHYGEGTVIESDMHKIRINFNKHGSKEFPSSSINKYIFIY